MQHKQPSKMTPKNTPKHSKISLKTHQETPISNPFYTSLSSPQHPTFFSLQTTVSATAYSSVKSNYITFLSYSRCGWRHTPLLPRQCRIHHSANPVVRLRHRSIEKFVIFALNEDVSKAAEIETQESELVQEFEQEENLYGAAAEEASDEDYKSTIKSTGIRTYSVSTKKK